MTTADDARLLEMDGGSIPGSADALDEALGERDCWVDGDVSALWLFEAGARWGAKAAESRIRELEGVLAQTWEPKYEHGGIPYCGLCGGRRARIRTTRSGIHHADECIILTLPYEVQEEGNGG